MSNMERLQHEGRLAETERRIKDLRLRLLSLRTSLRSELDPIDPVDGINGESVVSLALSLAGQHSELRELLEQAALIRTTLGR